MDEITTRKTVLLDALARLFAENFIDEFTLESGLRAVNAIERRDDLAPAIQYLSNLSPAMGSIFGDLAASVAGNPSGFEESETLNCNMTKVRKEGDWVRARRYEITVNMGELRLDFEEYESVQGFEIELDLNCTMSQIRLRIPEGFVVEDRLESRSMSEIKNRVGDSAYTFGRIILSGRIHMSTIKIKST